MQRLSPADVATHNKPDDIYVIVDENVYDLTEFQDDHPGISFFLLLFSLPEKTLNLITQEGRKYSHV